MSSNVEGRQARESNHNRGSKQGPLGTGVQQPQPSRSSQGLYLNANGGEVPYEAMTPRSPANQRGNDNHRVREHASNSLRRSSKNR